MPVRPHQSRNNVWVSLTEGFVNGGRRGDNVIATFSSEPRGVHGQDITGFIRMKSLYELVLTHGKRRKDGKLAEASVESLTGRSS
jgi:hypothetical protein